MRLILRLLAAALLLATFALAQPPAIPQVKVQFDNGTSSKTIKGQIKGYDSIDYVLRAAAGQTMTVTLTGKNRFNYFNVIPPGEEDVAIFNGSSDGNKYEGTLKASGDYKIRVYLMRNAARRNETAAYSLTIAVAGKPQ